MVMPLKEEYWSRMTRTGARFRTKVCLSDSFGPWAVAAGNWFTANHASASNTGPMSDTKLFLFISSDPTSSLALQWTGVYTHWASSDLFDVIFVAAPDGAS